MDEEGFFEPRTKRQIQLHFISAIVITIGALNWGAIGISGRNFIAQLFSEQRMIATFIYILIGLAGLYLVFERDLYLPFLSQGIVPCRLLQISQPDNWEVRVPVEVPPNAFVMYWAAEKRISPVMLTAEQAYNDFTNSGVALADSNGNAVLHLRNPQSYTVSKFGLFNQTLEPHVHYRVCGRGTGKLSEVKTKFLS